jgi:hypothetical protein
MGGDTESAQLVMLTVMLKMAQCQNVLGLHAECILICSQLLELIPGDYTEFVAAACCIRGAAYYTRVRRGPPAPRQANRVTMLRSAGGLGGSDESTPTAPRRL